MHDLERYGKSIRKVDTVPHMLLLVVSMVWKNSLLDMAAQHQLFTVHSV